MSDQEEDETREMRKMMGFADFGQSRRPKKGRLISLSLILVCPLQDFYFVDLFRNEKKERTRLVRSLSSFTRPSIVILATCTDSSALLQCLRNLPARYQRVAQTVLLLQSE